VKIVYSREMEKRYPTNPVENPDRVSLPAEMLEEFEFIEPIPAYLEDWGGLLKREDYREIGKAIREGSEEECMGRRFALLEGGYHPDLGWCIKSFIEGFR
jgi:hypothetical protein